MFIVGADLGQARDYTALLIVERKLEIHTNLPAASDGEYPSTSHYHVRKIERPELGTTYPTIVNRICELLSSPKLAPDAICALDATGVGRPIVDMLAEKGANVCPITITGGDRAHYNADDGMWRVPKKEIVSTIQVLLQRGRLKWLANTPDPEQNRLSETLLKELMAFRMKITAAANDTYEAWRERDHDDLVLGLGLALWLGERQRPVTSRAAFRKRDTMLERDLREARATTARPWWDT